MELLKSRIEEASLKITYNPPGDGLCSYSAAGYLQRLILHYSFANNN